MGASGCGVKKVLSNLWLGEKWEVEGKRGRRAGYGPPLPFHSRNSYVYVNYQLSINQSPVLLMNIHQEIVNNIKYS